MESPTPPPSAPDESVDGKSSEVASPAAEPAVPNIHPLPAANLDGYRAGPPTTPRLPPPGPGGVYHVTPGSSNGNLPGAKRGATAAEALATELHREIALRETVERRLIDSETRLAEAERQLAELRSAPPPAAPPPARERLILSPDSQRLGEIQTRLTQAEGRAAQAEQRLAYLMSSSPLGFFDADLATGNAYYSFGFKEMLGYRPEELPDTYQAFLELLHPEDRHSGWQVEREPVGEGLSRFTRQFRLRHKEEGYRWVESSGLEFHDAEGKGLRVIGFHRDITARKGLEERLHLSEERFNLLITSGPFGFFDTDMTTGRAFLSPLWKGMLGYRPDELPDLYQTWLDLLHPDDRAEAVATHKQHEYGETRRPYTHACRRRHRDGGFRWVQSSGIDFFAPDGRLLRTLGFTLDIHALKLAEEALAHETERLNVTLDSISDGVITTDSHGHVTYLNSTAEALCGLSSDDAADLPVEEFYRRAGAQARRQADNPVRAVLASGMRAAPHDPAHLQAPGRATRVVADNAAPITDSAGQMAGAVLVFHDITDSHRAAEEMQKAGRIESLGVLAGGIAHDFNNLLTAMLGNLSVARSGGDLPLRAADALGRAEKACWRARDLTGQLLTFARGGDPVRKTILLVPVLERAVRGATGNTGVGLHAHFEPDLPTVEADEDQLLQVFHNLALNAVQAMAGGGALHVHAALVSTPEVLAAVGDAAGTPAGAYVEVRLRDTGAGIAPENLSKIFDPFFSTRTNGTGLGLAIAYSVVRKHDGVIRVESTPGQGSTFTLYLPVSPSAAPPPRESPAERASRAGGRVLFMDDDPDIRDLAGAILGLIGYEAELTADGSETLTVYQQARAEGQPFAAVILDLTIPGGMGGKETIRRLREIDPGVRAIVSSGYSNDAVIADFRAHGFMAMVAKPYRMEDLARALTEAITGAAVP